MSQGHFQVIFWHRLSDFSVYNKITSNVNRVTFKYFCFLIEKFCDRAKKNRDFHVRMLKMMLNVQKSGLEKNIRCLCACVPKIEKMSHL